MNLPRLWTTGQEVTWDPFRTMRREMENALRAFDQNASSPDIGAGAPAISVAETKDAFEVTAELPGVDEKDIKVSLDDNQLVISGEKKAESTKEEKDWHVEERSLRLILPINVPTIRARRRSRRRSFRQGRTTSDDQEAREGRQDHQDDRYQDGCSTHDGQCTEEGRLNPGTVQIGVT